MNGKELQLKIKASGKSQKELAEKMGVHPTQFTAWFKQESVASGVIEQIAALLGMSMGQFYGETNGVASRNEQLRRMSMMAMQSLLIQSPNFDENTLKNKTYEQCIAELSVRQAMCMLDQFQKEGIDK